MSEADFTAAVASIFGIYACTADYPEGAEGYYVQAERLPYVVTLGPSGEPYAFTTADEAIAKARELRAYLDAKFATIREKCRRSARELVEAVIENEACGAEFPVNAIGRDFIVIVMN